MRQQSKLILQLLCTLLLFQHSFQEASAIAHFKPQPTSAQPKAQQTQQQQVQEQQQQQPVMQQHAQLQQQQQQQIQRTTTNMQENDPTHEVILKYANQDPDFGNPYKVINEIKREQHFTPSLFPPSHPSISPPPLSTPTWNPNPYINPGFAASQPYAAQPYSTPTYTMPPYFGSPFPANPYQATQFLPQPKYPPFFGYSQPIFIPYPPFMPPEYFYTAFSSAINDYDEVTSRSASGRRPPPLANARDSPIYYMRLPPTPYMFLPNFAYPLNQNGPTFSNAVNYPYQAISNYAGLGQTYNLPLNFLANGKPSGIHSFLPDIQNSLPFSNFNGFNPRPLAPHFSGNYFQPSYSSPSPSPPSPYQDSKLTSLKQPFYFNGRPEEIYVLQNSVNPLYSGL